jgi:hypothetical protein
MKLFRTSILALALGLTFVGCQKDDDTSSDEEISTTSSKNNEVADNLYSDIDNVVNITVPPLDEDETKSMALKSGESCAEITFVLSQDSSFVSQVTIDFGDGCDYQGRTRTGKIIISKTDKMRNVGAQTTITLEDYTVDGYAVEGTKTNTTSAVDWQTLTATYNTEVRNGKITAPDGATFTWESDRTTIIAFLSGEIVIKGTASGVNQLGIAYTANITNDIILKRDCKYITQGTLEINPEGFETRTVDYGDGTCDNLATVSVGEFSVQFEMR